MGPKKEMTVSFSYKSSAEAKAKSYVSQGVEAVKELPEYEHFKLSSTVLDWSSRRVSSRGGWYPKRGGAGINIAMRIAANNTCNSQIIRVYEYKSFDSDKYIGGFYTKKPELKLFMHCIHEIAHAAQYWGKYEANLNSGKPHGDVWKRIYKHLRVRTLNNYIEPQDYLASEYKKIIFSIDRNYFKTAASKA